MRCTRPVLAYAKPGGGITFGKKHSLALDVHIRCNQCIGCRLYRSREWAIRITHEAQLHQDNSFLTLTYSDENLPLDGSLVPEDHRNFIKRLRKRLSPLQLRYFHCGEYGEENLRPHYHCILFGYSDPDQIPWSKTPTGDTLYRSPLLEKTWELGHVLVGQVTPESAQYVASYTTKKLTVSKQSTEADYRKWSSRYLRADPYTGEIKEIAPEYSTSSNRPGIGKPWYDRYKSEVFPSDFVIIKGQKMPVPRYYELLLERENPTLYAEVKRKRIKNRDRSHDSAQRLQSMETCALARSTLHGKRNDSSDLHSARF